MKRPLLIIGCVFLIISSYAQFNQFNDTIRHFTFDYPDSWTPTGERGENLRTVLVSPDEKFTLAAYGFFMEDGHFDIAKLALLDTAWFSRLGEVKEANYHMVIPILGKRISESLFSWVDDPDKSSYVDKLYDKNKNGYYAHSYITVDDQYAYVLIAYSKTDDFSEIEPVFDSFEATASWVTKRKNDLVSLFSIRNLKDAVIVWIAWLLPVLLLVFLGGYFKKWKGRRKALNKFRASLTEGKEPDEKWKRAYKITGRKITYAILLAIIVGLVPTLYIVGLVPTLYKVHAFILIIFSFFFLLGYSGVKVKEVFSEMG